MAAGSSHEDSEAVSLLRHGADLERGSQAAHIQETQRGTQDGEGKTKFQLKP